ncbi:MAG: glucosaminidase domain-containing protein [Saprospiraceae bacterium]
MNRTILWLVIALWVTHSHAASANNQLFLDYIAQYKDIAIQEMHRTGIPASIKLAQALQESGAGTSELAVNANNHFGIKCSSDWTGKTYSRIDDESDAFGNPKPSCFRVYEDATESFVAHSEFLRQRRHYANLFQLDPTDYRSWAQGLLDAGYATDRQYAKRLIDLIERFQLQQYDRQGFTNNNQPIVTKPNTKPRPEKPTPVEPDIAEAGYYVLNDVRYVNAQANESLEAIARRTGTTVANLLAYNEEFTDNEQVLSSGTRVYIQPKRDFYRGRAKYHTVKNGETMFDIAQEYGVKLAKLYERNKMESGTQPAVNEEIKLRGAPAKNRPRLAKVTKPSTQQNPEYLFDEPIAPKPTTVSQKPAPTAKPTTGPTTPAPDEDFDGTDPFKQPTKDTTVTAPTAEAQYHIVKSGDTLWNISQRYKMTVEELKRLNKLDNTNIKIGMRLQVK